MDTNQINEDNVRSRLSGSTAKETRENQQQETNASTWNNGKQKTSDLLHWKDMPRHLQFNPYIFTGYRPLLSIWGCIHSLFYIHNETINIITHGKHFHSYLISYRIFARSGSVGCNLMIYVTKLCFISDIQVHVPLLQYGVLLPLVMALAVT